MVKFNIFYQVCHSALDAESRFSFLDSCFRRNDVLVSQDRVDLINKEVTLNNLTGKIVIVETQEMTYTGKLIEIGEEEVHLESEMGWIVIPIERITSIREKED